jgi:hypothetical protein
MKKSKETKVVQECRKRIEKVKPLCLTCGHNRDMIYMMTGSGIATEPIEFNNKMHP